MSTPQDKLAESLAILKKLQDKGIIAIHTKNMTRTHRERLIKSGFIKEVMKGWYIPAHPDEPTGESTAWYASFWGFCADYLKSRFDNQWCLSPEHSLNIHSGNWNVPAQLLVRTPKGGNKPKSLLHETSIMDLRLKLPDKNDIEIKENYSGPQKLDSVLRSNITVEKGDLFETKKLQQRIKKQGRISSH